MTNVQEKPMLPNTVDRVPAQTAEEINARIQCAAENRVHYLAANPAGIDERLRELDEEWDIERVLEAKAASVALTGSILAATCTNAGSYFLPW